MKKTIEYKDYSPQSSLFHSSKPLVAVVSESINVADLTVLADLLENFNTERFNLVIPVHHFALREWVVARNGKVTKVGQLRDPADYPSLQESCNTTACVAGFAMLHPYFRAKDVVDVVEVQRLLFGPSDPGHMSSYIFYETSYRPTHRGRRDVIKRIRKVVQMYHKLYPAAVPA